MHVFHQTKTHKISYDLIRIKESSKSRKTLGISQVLVKFLRFSLPKPRPKLLGVLSTEARDGCGSVAWSGAADGAGAGGRAVGGTLESLERTVGRLGIQPTTMGLPSGKLT